MLKYWNEQARQMKVNDEETPGADRLTVAPEKEFPGRGKIDKQEESCGIFGVYAPTADVARLTYFGLFALQHRGQESAGIVVSNGAQMACYARMGLVNQVFDESILGILKGYIASGHVRYSTTGSSTIANAQPMLIEGRHLIGNGNNTHSELVSLAISHNGNLVNTRELCRKERVLLGHGGVNNNVLRIQPPLVISEEQIQRIIDILDKCLSRVESKV